MKTTTPPPSPLFMRRQKVETASGFIGTVDSIVHKLRGRAAVYVYTVNIATPIRQQCEYDESELTAVNPAQPFA